MLADNKKYQLIINRITLFLCCVISSAAALNAPYLISADTLNDKEAQLIWRNNDFASTYILIIRKTNITAWLPIDSVPAATTVFTDSTLHPATEYFYALIAKTQTTASDTSNIVSIMLPPASLVLKQPRILISWAEAAPILINYYDSSTTEKGFRLYRKQIAGNWVVIDSQTSGTPGDIGWKTFRDSLTLPNSWYSYKVQTYNDSNSLFSFDTAVFTYVTPKTTNKYSINYLSVFPALVNSWIEKFGDSLFFPEVKPLGGSGISIINISQPSIPVFAGYLDTLNLPASLKGSPVAARIAFNGKYDYLVKQPGLFLAHRPGGMYPSLTNSKIFKFDTTLMPLDSFPLSNSYHSAKVIGAFNDSVYLLAFEPNNASGFSLFNSTYFGPVLFKSGKIDTFPVALTLQSGGQMMHYASWQNWGSHDKMAAFYNYSSDSRPFYSYVQLDFSNGYSNPMLFSYPDSITPFSSPVSPVFDSNIVITCAMNYPNTGISIYAYDIRNAHSGPNKTFLGKFVDAGFHGRQINKIIIDTLKKYVLVTSDSAISFYSYLAGPNNIHNGKTKLVTWVDKLKIVENNSNIEIQGISKQVMFVSIVDIKGRAIRVLANSGKNTLLWDKRNTSGCKIACGYFIALIHANDHFNYAKSFVIEK
jgi:hypothetical protein